MTTQDLTYKTERLNWHDLHYSQPENLKKTQKERMERLKTSMRQNGIGPFYVFERDGRVYLVDGHHRLKALYDMERAGEELPAEVVCNFFEVRDDAHLRDLIFALKSHYADFDKEGLLDFLDDGFDIDELEAKFDFPELEFLREDESKEKKSRREKKFCPHCGEEL